MEYLTAREVTRQQLVMDALERGNKEMQAQNEVAAAAEFRQALEFDPTNRIRAAAAEATPSGRPTKSRAGRWRLPRSPIDVRLSPSTERKDFHYRGDSRTLLTQIARAYGITATIDDSVQTRQLHFNIDNVTFAEAMEAATRATKTFWIALSGSQMYVVSDTVENRRNFERMAIRTFYLSDILTPQELMDTVNALRVLLDIRFVQQDAAESTITIRAPLADGGGRQPVDREPRRRPTSTHAGCAGVPDQLQPGAADGDATADEFQRVQYQSRRCSRHWYREPRTRSTS